MSRTAPNATKQSLTGDETPSSEASGDRSVASALRIRGLTKSYDNSRNFAVQDFSLNVEEGELIILLGPSGCGKTTVLSCVAGLLDPGKAHIEIGGSVVYDSEKKINVPPQKRNLGMVFQNYALWPHKTVEGNVAYPLRARHSDRRIRAEAVAGALEMVGVLPLRRRYPSQLSGGQQQRVALARALVARPALVLFDEPLSNLDALLRVEMRAEIRRLHREGVLTGIYVTHDQTEALSLGDRIVVMRDGVIEQVATPEVLFNSPVSPYVASFFGARNRMVLRRTAACWSTTSGSLSFPLTGLDTKLEELELLFRPEDVVLEMDVPDQSGARSAGLLLGVGQIDDVLFGGRTLECVLQVGGMQLHASGESDSLAIRRGATVRVGIATGRALLYGADGFASCL